MLGGSGPFLVKLADSCSQHTWDTNLKRKKEVVKVMLFCKLQRLSLPPPLYILLSGELTCLQLLAETVFRGVKPASSRPIKLQQGTRTSRCGRPRPGCPLNDSPDTPCWETGEELGRTELPCLGAVPAQLSSPARLLAPKIIPKISVLHVPGHGGSQSLMTPSDP